MKTSANSAILRQNRPVNRLVGDLPKIGIRPTIDGRLGGVRSLAGFRIIQRALLHVAVFATLGYDKSHREWSRSQAKFVLDQLAMPNRVWKPSPNPL